MNEKDLSEQLHEMLSRSEPPLTLTSDVVKAKSRRVRTSRRLVTGGAILGIMAVGLLGVRLAGAGSPDQDQLVADSLQGFTPERLADDMSASANRSNTDGPRFLTTDVIAFDEQDNPISGADRDKASRWRGTFTWAPGQLMEIYLGHGRSEAEGDVRDSCRRELEAQLVLECEVTTGTDGTVTISTVRAARRLGSGWPVVIPRDYDELGKDLWFLHSVEARRGGDFVTSASEMVKAGSVDEALKTWHLDEAELRDIATDPDLAFPKPPAGSNGCAWIVPEKADAIHCDG